MLDCAAFPEQRQSFIRQLLLTQGRVVCLQLAEQLHVSEHTIRRDLKELASNGLCRRVYGGAVSTMPSAESFNDRSEQHSTQKEAITARCAQLVKDKSCIFIDSGTTNLALAKAIPQNFTLTVVTNSPIIAVELINNPACEVIMLAGKIVKKIGGTVGGLAQAQIKNIYIDQLFLGGCAMDIDAGLTVFDYEDAEFKKVLVKQSDEIIIGLTADKIPAIARYAVASCDEITSLVVENRLSASLISSFEQRDIKIELA